VSLSELLLWSLRLFSRPNLAVATVLRASLIGFVVQTVVLSGIDFLVFTFACSQHLYWILYGPGVKGQLLQFVRAFYDFRNKIYGRIARALILFGYSPTFTIILFGRCFDFIECNNWMQ
jgi:hypothetical protein